MRATLRTTTLPRILAILALALLGFPLAFASPAAALYPKKGDSDPHRGVRDARRKAIQGIDVSRWQEAARAHGEVFGEIRPASTFVEVKGLIDKGWLVEIEADCVADADQR